MAYGKKKCGAKCPCASCKKKKTMKMGSRKAPKKAARKRK